MTDACFAEAAAAVASGKRAVILAPDFPRALRYRRTLAAQGMGFGVAVSLFDNWIAELWEIHGDGRTPVTSGFRTLTIWKLVQEGNCSPRTPGVADTLARAARIALPHLVNACAPDSPNEHEALEVLRAYDRVVREADMIELCEAMELLAGNPNLATYRVFTLGIETYDTTVMQDRFLQAIGAQRFSCSREHAAGAPNHEIEAVLSNIFKPKRAAIKPTGALRCALSTGPTAEAHTIARAVEEAIDRGAGDTNLPTAFTVAVTARHPFDLFMRIAPLLNKKGIHCGVSDSIAFIDTDAGRACCELAEIIEAAREPLFPDSRLATDYTFNPFSGVSIWNAYNEDKKNRGDRLADGSFVLDGISGTAHSDLAGVVGLFEQGEVAEALDVLTAYALKQMKWPAAYRSLQLAALRKAATFLELADEAQVPYAEAFQLMEDMTVPFEASAEDATVFIGSQEWLSRQPACSYKAVVLGNLSSDTYAVAQRGSALDGLLDLCGMAPEAVPLKRAQDTFFDCLDTARSAVVLQRSIHNDQSDDLSACVTFTETMDLYRDRTTSSADMDKTLAIPKRLRPFATSVAETDPLGNVTGAPQKTQATVDLPEPGTLPQSYSDLVVLPRGYGENHDQYFDGPDLSPSQIESYLECPYQWFAKRRLRLESPDEGFGPLEQGSFTHAVLESFFRSFSATQGKVTDSNLADAQTLLAETFDTMLAEQPDHRHGSRYAPITDAERRTAQGLRRKLLDYLATESTLLPGFEPRHFEWKYGTTAPVSYAGANITGSVDRIDVDACGNAVVIDYKSSTNEDYRLRTKADIDEGTFTLPRKMQALIYAKVVRDLLGYNVVGALYVNPLKGEAVGAYSSIVLNPDDMPLSCNCDYCSVPFGGTGSFDALLEETEHLVEQRLANLAAGDIHPQPISAKACAYCPVALCEERKTK